ncbi:MAG TPA: AI-2E family transporter [Streptosporangiaceae bacterium]|nr:AI-2E family transporter [Streptosporangiaceae bacterium]
MATSQHASAGPDQTQDEQPGAGGAQRQDGQPAADDGQRTADEIMQEAVEVAHAVAEESGGLGKPGRPIDRRSPFFVGMAAAAGVAVTYGVAELVIRARSVLVLIGLALFIAAGLDPAVSWLSRRWLPRWAAVLAVLAAALGILAVFLVTAIPPLTAQASTLATHVPHYLHSLSNPHSDLGRLNLKYHIEKRIQELLSSHGSAIAGGVLGAGEVVLSAATSLLVVLVLTVYFLAGLPRIKLFLYRLAPRSRRARVILIGDEIFTKVGGYLLGNILTSLVAGVGTYLWMLSFGIPYPALLGLLVALLDLIPVVGSTIGGAVVTLVALTVSLPVALATLGFYVCYRFAEDYLLVPRVMGRTVQVPAAVTVVAVLIGAALLGLIGALVAIPAAAAVRLLLQEVTFRRMDST